MPSVLTLTAFLLREGGGGEGFIREGGLLQISTSRRAGGLIRKGG